MTDKLQKYVKQVFDGILKLAFPCFFASSIYVYFDILFPNVSFIIYLIVVLIGFLFIYLTREKIFSLYNKIVKYLSKQSPRKVSFSVIIIMIASITIYGLIAGFDSTRGGDISIYVQLAEDIVNNGNSQLGGLPPYLSVVGFLLSLFYRVGIPYFIGMIVLFLIATTLNFKIFSKIIGYENASIVTVGFVLTPSIALWPYCITHEIFLYFFFTLVFYYLGKLIEKQGNLLVNICCLFFFTLFAYMVSPMGLTVIITALIITFVFYKKIVLKFIIISVIVISMMSGNFIRDGVFNKYVIDKTIENMPFSWSLFVGSNYETDGRYLSDEMEQVFNYINDNNLNNSNNKFSIATNALLKERYSKLLNEPNKIIKLLSKKFYIAWSGNFYSVELSGKYRQLDNPSIYENVMQYVLLGISSLIYMSFIVLGIVGIMKRNNNYNRNNKIYIYKCMLLGTVAVLLLSEIMNKYSSHQTLFIYLISVSFLSDKLLQGD